MTDDSKPFVEQVHIQSFGCVRDATLELTRLHALIGPNDSGKSTVLAAIRTAGDLIQFGDNLPPGRQRDSRDIAGSQISMRLQSGLHTTELALIRTEDYWILNAAGPGVPKDQRHFPLQYPA
ncbi:MAG TPA: AAA family ATPase, partial [Kofleriaceae bacterium]|nr:AAA family ATPase [Kofleriaceae bacterium]